MDLGISGRPALVAASSRGLGKACALSLAAEGARVAICGRDERMLNATRDEIADATGAEVVAIPADVGTEEGAVGFVRRAAEALGGCEILVTSSGGPRPGRFDELTDEDFRAAVDLLLLSAIRMTREALPSMREAGYGRVVIIGSFGMKQPIPGLMLSNAIRGAVAGWAKTLAGEVAPDGITVNAVLPLSVSTDRIRELQEDRAARSGQTVEEVAAQEAAAVPVGRMGEPRDVGDLVAYLASERASFLTGCFIPVDGGRYAGLL